MGLKPNFIYSRTIAVFGIYSGGSGGGGGGGGTRLLQEKAG